MMRLILCTFCAVLLFVSETIAQDQPQSDAEQGDTAKGDTAQPEIQPSPVMEKPTPSDSSDSLKAEIDELKKRVAEVESENASLKGRMDASEQASEAAALKQLDEEFRQRLDIYGFLDVEFFYIDMDKGDSAQLLFPIKPSFTENHLNLYFSGRMTRTLSVLAEIRYTFFPHGNDTDLSVPLLGREYSRANTTTLDSYDWRFITMHSLVIERAAFTWKPYEFLGISAGRFITPFGIWVTDHAPTESIPARLPQLITNESIPLAQTGLKLFGRVFPLDDTYVDYAVTVSNGRGPSEALFDYDDNKALGLRLKATYEIEGFTASLGGFIYWGKYTDVSKEVVVDASEPEFNVNTTESYEEVSTAVDVTLELYGFRLQGELVRQPRMYTVRPLRFIRPFIIQDPLGGYTADDVGWFSYGLLAYKIPLQIASTEIELTPFGLYEYNKYSFYYPESVSQGYRFGLNLRPSPFVVIKYESCQEKLEYDAVPALGAPKDEQKYWVHSAQIAVSF